MTQPPGDLTAEPVVRCAHCGRAGGLQPAGLIASKCAWCGATVCDLHGELLTTPDGRCAVCHSEPFAACHPACPCCACRAIRGTAEAVRAGETGRPR